MFLLLMAAIWLHGCAVADVYNMQGMEGRVVDKATQQPLEGVMVVEVWEVGGGFEGHTVDYLPLGEAETDSIGRYSFPARGAGNVSEGFLKEYTPRLIFFKPGYVFFSKGNRYHPDRRFEYNRRSDWDGKTIEMEKFEGSPQEWAKELERFGGVLGNLNRGEWCGWMGIPRTLSLLHKEYLGLRQQGIRASVAIGAPWVIDELKECPSSDQFFEAYEK
jgi:hypothetical protein